MNHHLKSLIITSLLWSLMIFLLVHSFSKTSELTPVSLEIYLDASGKLKNKHNASEILGQSGTKERHHDSDNDNNKTQSIQNLEPIHQPLPAIPDDLRGEAFNSFAIARFYINQAGDVENVELIQPSANPRLNQLLLKSLKKWKFSANNRAMNKDIKVNFEVK